MRNLAASEIRRLHRKIAQLDRRVGLVDIAGKVKAGSQDMDKRTVVLVLGQGSDGKDILSPPVRWEGTGAGAVKMPAVPADNEQMTLHSPSGTVGGGSMARWGTFDEDNPPPSTSKDEAVQELGKAKITYGKDYIEVAYDADQWIKIKQSGDIIVAVPKKGTLYLGGDPDKGSDFALVSTVSGPSTTVKAFIG